MVLTPAAVAVDRKRRRVMRNCRRGMRMVMQASWLWRQRMQTDLERFDDAAITASRCPQGRTSPPTSDGRKCIAGFATTSKVRGVRFGRPTWLGARQSHKGNCEEETP